MRTSVLRVFNKIGEAIKRGTGSESIMGQTDRQVIDY